jgi:hypothetical protein
MKSQDKIVEYMDAFYGVEGIYPIGFSEQQIKESVAAWMASDAFDVVYGFDSVDRENLRDVMVEKYGLQAQCDAAYGIEPKENAA